MTDAVAMKANAIGKGVREVLQESEREGSRDPKANRNTLSDAEGTGHSQQTGTATTTEHQSRRDVSPQDNTCCPAAWTTWDCAFVVAHLLSTRLVVLHF
jgi:hypothetical protein